MARADEVPTGDDPEAEEDLGQRGTKTKEFHLRPVDGKGLKPIPIRDGETKVVGRNARFGILDERVAAHHVECRLVQCSLLLVLAKQVIWGVWPFFCFLSPTRLRSRPIRLTWMGWCVWPLELKIKKREGAGAENQCRGFARPRQGACVTKRPSPVITRSQLWCFTLHRRR